MRIPLAGRSRFGYGCGGSRLSTWGSGPGTYRAGSRETWIRELSPPSSGRAVRVLLSGVPGPVDPGRLVETLDWLVERAHENLGTEVVLRSVVAGADQWRVATVGSAGGVAGVSVWAPGGQWFLEADSELAATQLAELVWQASGRRPAKLTTSGNVKVWLRPWLTGPCGGRITREHDLMAMACEAPTTAGEGRWATPADRESLELYQAAYNEERGTSAAPDWDAVLGRRTVAVLEHGGRIVAVVKRTADTARFATIGGTWTNPEYRRRGLGARVTAFITGALLMERPAVHLIVDDDNTAAIALYRSLGFHEMGRCHMAYLANAEEPQSESTRRGRSG